MTKKSKNINDGTNITTIKNESNIDSDKKAEIIQDKVGQLYKKINFLEKITQYFFYINLLIVLSFIFHIQFKNWFILLHICFSIIYNVLSKYIDLYLKNNVETEHRKTFIKNALNANITENNSTNNYYNNSEKESIKKMGLNCFESLLFSEFIANKMIREEFLKTTGLVLIFISLVISTHNLLDFTLLISQAFLSLEKLYLFIKLLYFKNHVTVLYSDIYSLFVTSRPKNDQVLIAKILDITMNYECLKYFCKISLSSRIFNKYNSALSKEWDDIYHKKIESTNANQ
ncbi:hypothetical protein H8356DRAFT_989649 [Neocallimastix lanati (nom. inval.)]|jgi:hypothetical protein|nr:hypothetical protein H8356DRAFT_989649 [Neocallimastix sp. JGI-2020a]